MTAGGASGPPRFQLGNPSEQCYNAVPGDSPWLLPAVDAAEVDRVAVSENRSLPLEESTAEPQADNDAIVETQGEIRTRVPVLPRPQTLEIASREDRSSSVRWFVDAAKLKQKQVATIVSPAFEIQAEDGLIPFKLVVRARRSGLDQRKHVTFRDSEGRGTIELKCESSVDDSTGRCNSFYFRMSLGRGDQTWRNSLRHNFATSAVGLLSQEEQEEWEFPIAVDKESGTFAVCLEIMPAPTESDLDISQIWQRRQISEIEL